MLSIHEMDRMPPGRSRRAKAMLRHKTDRDPLSVIAENGIRLQFQPRRCLRDNVVSGAELQLHWPHRRGSCSAGSAQHCNAGLNAALGWALRQACGCAAVWPYGAITVAVSGEQLREPCVARYVAAALDESGLTPDRLELAVPESDVIDMGVDELLTLSALRDLGVGVAIDDFGGVLGSLMPLRRMPLTGLKISRTLVRGIPDDREDEAVLRAAVGLAQSVHLSVVADGIENETQRRFLSELGCDEGQGSLMGPAMLPGAFGAIL